MCDEESAVLNLSPGNNLSELVNAKPIDALNIPDNFTGEIRVIDKEVTFVYEFEKHQLKSITVKSTVQEK